MNLVKRLATAAVLIPIAFVSIQYCSRECYFCVVQLIILAALVEFYNLPRKKNISPPKFVGIICALLIGLSFLFPSFSLHTAIFAGLIILGVYFLLTTKTLEKLMQFPAAIALTFFGAVYLGFTLAHFIPLRDEYGPFYIYFLLSVIFIGDTGAFLLGKKWGRHKLAPLASPKKTWEGTFGGIITACLTGVLAQQILLKDEMSLMEAVVFALLINIIAQISDPLESLFKRAAGVKDSSNLLPGHGGFFDRIDSLIFAAPFFYYLLKYYALLS